MALQAVAENRDGLLVATADADKAAVVEGVSANLVGGPSRIGGFPQFCDDPSIAQITQRTITAPRSPHR
jgi:hypothetical protein